MECMDMDEFFDADGDTGSKGEDDEEVEVSGFTEPTAKIPEDISSEPAVETPKDTGFEQAVRMPKDIGYRLAAAPAGP
jgi:hypothetical protein